MERDGRVVTAVFIGSVAICLFDYATYAVM